MLHRVLFANDPYPYPKTPPGLVLKPLDESPKGEGYYACLEILWANVPVLVQMNANLRELETKHQEYSACGNIQQAEMLNIQKLQLEEAIRMKKRGVEEYANWNDQMEAYF